MSDAAPNRLQGTNFFPVFSHLITRNLGLATTLHQFETGILLTQGILLQSFARPRAALHSLIALSGQCATDCKTLCLSAVNALDCICRGSWQGAGVDSLLDPTLGDAKGCRRACRIQNEIKLKSRRRIT